MKSLSVAAALAAGAASDASADFTVMDQIGPNPSFVQGNSASASQNFGPALVSYNIAVVDDFSLTGTTTLSSVSAALLGYGGFRTGDFATISGYQVAIYSTPAAAAASGTGLAGNVYNLDGASGTLIQPYGTDGYSALATIPINVTLAAGTYYIAVIPMLPYLNDYAQVGVYDSSFGGYPGGSNAFQVNPGGGFGFAGNLEELGVDAAYRITGISPASMVPAPPAVVMFASGLVLAVRATRRRATSA